jgi:carbohydrate-selective porin OprB
MTGDEIHVGFAVNFGTSLSAHYVGNSFPIQLADVAGTQPRLTYLSYTQSLFDDRLTVRVGRLTVNSVFGEELLGSEYFKAFTSVGFDLIPLGLFLNAPGAFGFFDTGLVAYGPLSIRPKDSAALGVVYGSHSARLERANGPCHRSTRFRDDAGVDVRVCLSGRALSFSPVCSTSSIRTASQRSRTLSL